jgi:3-oxoacyl-[acyl-carrier protein] reductase
LTEEAWDEALNSILKGAFLCTQAAARLMKKRPSPAIVNITSESALTGHAGGAHFVAAQAGLIGLTKAVARELAPHIRVNCVAVGGAENDLATKYYDWSHAVNRQTVQAEKTESHAPPAPDEVARACLYLLSSDAGAITGQTLVIGSSR